jgi:S-adenosylmethionine synthetase
VDTYGTGAMDDLVLQNILENEDIFDFRPAAIIQSLGLLEPNGWSYQQTAAYGHFGRDIFPWEKTDKVKALRKAAGDRAAA